MTDLKKQRNDEIVREFEGLYNVNTWNKVKVTFIYEELGRKYYLSPNSIRKIIYEQ